MPEFSFSSAPKKKQINSPLLPDLFLPFSFILSQPLYFSYFIFFSPYLLKLISFLSPLFITTSLLLLALLTLSPGLIHHEFSESKLGFLLSKLQSDEDEEFRQFEELDVYKIVFEVSTFEVGENTQENHDADMQEPVDKFCLTEAGPMETTLVEFGQLLSTIGSQENDEFDNKKEEKEVIPLSNKVEEQKAASKEKEEEWYTPTAMVKSQNQIVAESILGSIENLDSKRVAESNLGSTEKLNSKGGAESNLWSTENGNSIGVAESNLWSSENCNSTGVSESNLGSFGSMRKEKEWKRTLAGKLFEERHCVEGEEEMDSLWETYESDSMKAKAKWKKGEIYKYEDEDEEDDEDIDTAQLCCLQALKLSTGKMNFGMRRPNMVKFSKALKGIGWLHHVSKMGKKGYH